MSIDIRISIVDINVKFVVQIQCGDTIEQACIRNMDYARHQTRGKLKPGVIHIPFINGKEVSADYILTDALEIVFQPLK